MFKESNRIIVVDNIQEDLDRIAHEFNLKGIGCKTLLYDGINFPEEPLSNVRIAFFDVNLAQAFSDQDKYAILENAIKSYIAADNGPYVLIFWTNNSDWKNGFIQFINRDPNSENVVRDKLKPFYISIIDKTTITEDNTLEFMLKQQLGNQIVELCLNFDDQLIEASNITTSKLLSMIPMGDRWGDTLPFEDGVKKLFSKIAISSWGISNAKENPDGAINDALLPVIAHSLPQLNLWKSFLNAYISPLENDKSIYPKGDVSLMKLNSFFLIDKALSNANSRGAVVKLKSSLFEDYFEIDFNTWKKNEFGESSNLNDAIPIAVEISAACDFCQQNHRNNKYLMGIACPKEIPNKKKINIFIADAFILDDKPLYVAFDFNYVLIDHKLSIIENVLFGFKKEMMDMIGNKYANHISRIGITSFR